MKYLKRYWLFVSVCYWFIYVCGCFLKREIYNPFWWMLRLPYDEDIRGYVFLIFLCILIIGGGGYINHKDKLKIKENEHSDKFDY